MAVEIGSEGRAYIVQALYDHYKNGSTTGSLVVYSGPKLSGSVPPDPQFKLVEFGLGTEGLLLEWQDDHYFLTLAEEEIIAYSVNTGEATWFKIWNEQQTEFMTGDIEDISISSTMIENGKRTVLSGITISL